MVFVMFAARVLRFGGGLGIFNLPMTTGAVVVFVTVIRVF
jgi:hypothetical protein